MSKCISCYAVISNQKSFYRVMQIDANGLEILSPCCSKECAIVAKEKNIKFHQSRAEKVRNTRIKTININRS